MSSYQHLRLRTIQSKAAFSAPHAMLEKKEKIIYRGDWLPVKMRLCGYPDGPRKQRGAGETGLEEEW